MSVGSTEILLVAEAVAREKGVQREVVLSAIEEALQVAAKKKYGCEHELRATVDRKTGELRLYRELIIPSDSTEVSGSIKAVKLEGDYLQDGTASIGTVFLEQLPPLDATRFFAQLTRGVVVAKLREVERAQQYEEFKDYVGEILQGVVDKIEFGNIIVKIGTAEAVISKNNLLKTDHYRYGERVKACLSGIDRDAKGPQLTLSRIHNDFLVKLFEQEVPEVYDGIISIRGVARDPGSRSKVAVYTGDGTIDPVGSCIGVGGSRIRPIVKELQGEKIDVIPWSPNKAKFIIDAFSPIPVSKVVIDEDAGYVEVVIAEDHKSAAIGRRGQNIKLISELVGMHISLITEEDEVRRRQEEFSEMTNLFIRELDLEEILAQVLASEGYSSISALAKESVGELTRKISGLDDEIAQELINRASEHEAKQAATDGKLAGCPHADQHRE